MNRTKYLKTFIDFRFFELPENSFKSKLTAIKFHYIKNKINLVHPFLFLCNKTTSYDRYLISSTLKGNFVFLKDQVVQNLHNGKYKDDELKEIYKAFKILKEAFISVVMFPEKNTTVFGNAHELEKPLTNFIFNTGLDIKFLSLVGTYFAMPIWAKEFRKCETRFHQQYSIKHDVLFGISETELNDAINNRMPSSATTYSHTYNPYIRSNKKAQNLETILYCCPNCNNFFSLYSEFNCLKCKNCGTAVELSSNGNILLSSKVTDIDSFAEYQYKVLSNLYFDDKHPMIEYPAIKVMKNITELTNVYMGIAGIKIYCNKVVVTFPTGAETFKLKDFVECKYSRNNTFTFFMKNGNIITLCGDKKENFYIIADLLKFMQQLKN